MTAKSKWFRTSLSALLDIQPILVESVLTETKTRALLQVLSRKFAITDKLRVFFESLISMRADARLARNLKIAIRQILANDDRLFDENERETLRRLDTAGMASEEKQTAQALLNVYERYQLVKVLTPLFQRARTRV